MSRVQLRKETGVGRFGKPAHTDWIGEDDEAIRSKGQASWRHVANGTQWGGRGIGAFGSWACSDRATELLLAPSWRILNVVFVTASRTLW